MVPGVKALIFDVFGTLVDWRSSVALQARDLLEPLGVATDWYSFADAWRGEYQGAMEAVRSGEIGFCKLDVLHRRNLDIVLGRLGGAAADVDDGVRSELNRVWHRLDAWPDVHHGLQTLRHRYRLAPCSNGHVGLMINLARHNHWHWDAILGAEVTGNYKPRPEVYRRACELLDLQPPEVMMVAAHSDDLAAAAACGLRTGFLPRPDEHGPGRGERGPAGPVDHEFPTNRLG